MEKERVNRLVIGLGRGDADAFTELYNGLKGPLYSFVYNHEMSYEDMQDLLHDIFAEVIEGSPCLKSYENCFGWIFTIAKYKAVNFCKKLTRDAAYREAAALERRLACPDSEQDNIERLDLRYAIEQLPKDTQRMLSLYYVHEYTYKKLSDIFGKSIDRVQRQLHGAIKKLKEILNYTQKEPSQIDNLIVEVFTDGQI